MKINKETFEVFEPVDKFDTLLDYQTGSIVFGQLFDSSKIIIGDDKDPNRKFTSHFDHLQTKPKSYKTYGSGLSVYEKFNSLPDNFTYPIISDNNEPEILVSKESQDFLKLFNKKNYTTNPDNIFDYNIESSHLEFLSFPTLSDTVQNDDFSVIPSQTVQKTNNIIHNETKNIVNETNTVKEHKSFEKLEKIWEKIIEKKESESKVEQTKNIENKFNNIENTLNNQYINNNINNKSTENYNSSFSEINNFNQNNKTEYNQQINQITEVINNNLEQKISKVVTEINTTIALSQSDMLSQVKKIVQSTKEESEANKKEISNNTTKILKDFMRS